MTGVEVADGTVVPADLAHGDPASGRFVLRHRVAGRVTGVVGVDMPRELRAESEHVVRGRRRH